MHDGSIIDAQGLGSAVSQLPLSPVRDHPGRGDPRGREGPGYIFSWQEMLVASTLAMLENIFLPVFRLQKQSDDYKAVSLAAWPPSMTLSR